MPGTPLRHGAQAHETAVFHRNLRPEETSATRPAGSGISVVADEQTSKHPQDFWVIWIHF